MEEDRRQRCARRHSRQLGRRGVVDDRPEERSVVLFYGSVGSAMVGLACGVTERRGVAVDSAAGVRECARYSSGGIRRETSSSAWRARATRPIAWGHVEQQRHAAPAVEARWRGRDNVVRTVPARRAVARRTVGRCQVV
jgi:hypothetical protein